MRKTRLILGALLAAALACTGCGKDADSTANVDLEAMTSEAETTPEEEPEVIVKTSIVTEIVSKPVTERKRQPMQRLRQPQHLPLLLQIQQQGTFIRML